MKLRVIPPPTLSAAGRRPPFFVHPPGIPMSASPPTARELVDRLDSRHEELIQKLDELNARIERTLAECLRSRAAAREDDDSRKAA
jgi:hypothetical protein